MNLQLKDLKPGDEFEYVITTQTYRRGKFIVLNAEGCYLQPVAKEKCVFIFSFITNRVSQHWGHNKVNLVSKTGDKMKVSERIKQIQDRSIVEQGVFICRLAQLEAEIIATLQTARAEAYRIGYEDRDHVGKGGNKKIEEENNMQNSMGHFTNWEFGVPVKVSSRNFSSPYTDQVLLIDETDDTFTVKFISFIKKYNKDTYCYKLILYKYGGHSGGVFGPRYPVCSSPDFTAYCNARSQMTTLDSTSEKLRLYPAATFAIDSITIKFSAETTTELKKELGIQPTIMDVNSAVWLRKYMEENNLQHLLPPVRTKLALKHLNIVFLAPKFRAAVLQHRAQAERNRNSGAVRIAIKLAADLGIEFKKPDVNDAD